MTQQQVAGWDLTISEEKSTPDPLQVAKALKEVFKKWVFQKEKGDEGYVHWQVRGSLYKKRRQKDVIENFGELLWNAHWSPTSTTVHKGNHFNYVMKADTRVEGPWKDTDDIFEDPPVLTRQLKKFYEHNPYPWQSKVRELVQRVDDRWITCIVDPGANKGKSVLVEALEYERLAYEVPPMTCMEDIMQCCMCLKPQKAYCIDMPRSMKKEKLASFYAGIEALKNGVMYDKRHFFKKRRIDRPQILVFTNTLPDFSLLSLDRWQVYFVTDECELAHYQIPAAPPNAPGEA